MSVEFDLRSREYWLRMAWGLLIGLLSAIGAFIFVGIMDWGQGLVLPDLTDWTPFSGSRVMVIIMTSFGFLVGLVHHFTSATQLDVFEAVDNGRLDPKPVPSSLLASLLSLIGGFAIGPEVPTGMLAAGLGTWVSDERKMDSKKTQINVLSGVSSAYSGLFSSPFAMLLILLESRHVQSIAYYGTLFITTISGVIGFALFYGLAGDSPSSLLGLLSPPEYDLRLWHLAAAVLLGIVAVPFGLLLPVFNKIFSRLVMPLNKKPILRSTVGGLLLGLLSVALPTTIGLGTKEMSTVTEQAAEIGVILLIVFALAKVLALSGALSFGFIGGPIFPLLFVGSSVGAAINLLFPQLPLGLVLGCMIVAVPASIVPIPLALALIGMVIIGISITNVLPVLIAALVAFSITHGLLMKSTEKPE